MKQDFVNNRIKTYQNVLSIFLGHQFEGHHILKVT